MANLKISRAWAMPSEWTFTIKPIRELLKRYRVGHGSWIDPFAGRHSPASLTNDLNPRMETDHNEDALYFLSRIDDAVFDGGLYDPPYSVRQAAECYRKVGREHLTASVTSFAYWSKCKDHLARVIRSEGISISFGWNSTGLGMQRGFKLHEILLVSHGGAHNDTIITVEVKQ